MSRDFDGTDDYIDLGDSSVWDFGTGDFTLMAWIRPETVSDTKRMEIISKDGTGTPGRQLTMEFNGKALAGTRGSFRIALFQADAILSQIVAYDAPQDSMVANIWYHVAGVKRGNAAGSFTGFINGNSVTMTRDATLGDFPLTMQATATVVRIGNRALVGNTDEFDGQIAHAQAFNVALTQNEIRQTMRYPGSIRRGLIRFFPLWGGSPEGDYSGNNNSGTISGATLSTNNPPINGIFTVPKPELIHAF